MCEERGQRLRRRSSRLFNPPCLTTSFVSHVSPPLAHGPAACVVRGARHGVPRASTQPTPSLHTIRSTRRVHAHQISPNHPLRHRARWVISCAAPRFAKRAHHVTARGRTRARRRVLGGAWRGEEGRGHVCKAKFSRLARAPPHESPTNTRSRTVLRRASTPLACPLRVHTLRLPRSTPRTARDKPPSSSPRPTSSRAVVADV